MMFLHHCFYSLTPSHWERETRHTLSWSPELFHCTSVVLLSCGCSRSHYRFLVVAVKIFSETSVLHLVRKRHRLIHAHHYPHVMRSGGEVMMSMFGCCLTLITSVWQRDRRSQSMSTSAGRVWRGCGCHSLNLKIRLQGRWTESFANKQRSYVLTFLSLSLSPELQCMRRTRETQTSAAVIQTNSRNTMEHLPSWPGAMNKNLWCVDVPT